MDLIQFLLEQRVIVLAAGFTVLLFMTVIGLELMQMIRTMRREWAKERAAVAELRRQAREKAAEEEIVIEGTVVATAASLAALAAGTEADTPAPEAAAGTVTATVMTMANPPETPTVKPVALVSADKPKTEDEKDKEKAADSAMKSLLSDVFVDETTAARMKVLLEGIPPTTIEDLLRDSEKIAKQLKALRDGAARSGGSARR
jgi:hypothetical protein